MILKILRLATRRSPLALWQANDVARRLKLGFPEIEIEIVGLSTEGDRNRAVSLSTLGGKGVFVKELELALLAGQADFAVHSMKDVPSILPDDLGLVAMCERADPTDALVSNRYETLAELPAGARIGSSSLRRCLQLSAAFPNLVFEDLRGNVETRLKRLDDGDFEGIILATAGLERLELSHRISEKIDVGTCIPSAGQGAVGIEARTDREELVPFIHYLNHASTHRQVSCERWISRSLGATCNLPVGAHAEMGVDEGNGFLQLSTFVSDLKGDRFLRVSQKAAIDEADQLAHRVADLLIDQGALELIEGP
ncbi:MAG: hydroxymethylbilane synthase [Pseudomonadales bacterium]